MLKNPGVVLCLRVFAMRLVFMVMAPVAVAIGLVTGKIRQGATKVLGQWAGAYWTLEGVQETGYAVYPIEADDWYKVYLLPDEPGLGLYEPTVSKIFHSYGWYVTAYYQMALRNVAQGYSYQWAEHYTTPVAGPNRTWSIFGIGYGWKQYEDWRAYSQEEIASNTQARRYYAVPDFFVSAEDAA